MVKFLFHRPVDDRFDKNVFIVAFLFGVAVILGSRAFGDMLVDSEKPIHAFDFVAVLMAIGIIAAYTTYIILSPDRSSISLDRAGDNAYYLGLLFTLVSLGFSLVIPATRGTGHSSTN